MTKVGAVHFERGGLALAVRLVLAVILVFALCNLTD
jgi:hypothetical protein